MNNDQNDIPQLIELFYTAHNMLLTHPEQSESLLTTKNSLATRLEKRGCAIETESDNTLLNQKYPVVCYGKLIYPYAPHQSLTIKELIEKVGSIA